MGEISEQISGDSIPCVQFCTRKAGYGCGKLGSDIVEKLLEPEIFADWKAGNSVSTLIEGVRVTIEHTPCTRNCSALAVARAVVGEDREIILFRTAADLRGQLSVILQRTHEEWLTRRPPVLTPEQIAVAEAEFEAWITASNRAAAEREWELIRQRREGQANNHPIP